MSVFATTASQVAYSWFFIPSALLLGALHGLEPGHSKTMMAAFIVAIRGTAGQAVLLALAATISHTAIVWIVALGGVAFGEAWLSPGSEPYFKLASAVLVIVVGLWMLLRRLHDRHHHGHGQAREDAHEAAHAHAIERDFQGRSATTGQIVLFGLTGGLIPCPAAITVLLLCLQTHRLWLGAVLVLTFSIGLALTLMASGLFAAIGMRQATRRWPHLEGLMARAPYGVSLITLALGAYLGAQALFAL